MLVMITSAEIGRQIASFIRQLLQEGLDVITPITDAIVITMVVAGLVMIGLRQEWAAMRLIIGGVILLVIMRFIVPMLLSFL